MAARRPTPWAPLVAALVTGAALAGTVAWRLQLVSVEGRITQTRQDLKRLVLAGRIPPNQDVMAYFTAHHRSLEQRYEEAAALIASPAPSEAAGTDPQLYFQEQFHDVEATLERLATAREMPVPEQLGFPKELPPSDTVPRLLAQLALVREAATLVIAQGVDRLHSLKIEDPQAVPEEGEAERSFVTRVPVRVRLSATLPVLLNVLGTLERASPIIDVSGMRILPGPGPDVLEAELVLSRYMVLAVAQEPDELVEVETEEESARRGVRSRERRLERGDRASRGPARERSAR